MGHLPGLSVKETSVCILDDAGKIVKGSEGGELGGLQKAIRRVAPTNGGTGTRVTSLMPRLTPNGWGWGCRTLERPPFRKRDAAAKP